MSLPLLLTPPLPHGAVSSFKVADEPRRVAERALAHLLPQPETQARQAGQIARQFPAFRHI
jgi:hypothetical protein